MNNKLTIKWNTKAIILYTLYWIMAIIMVVLVAIISPLHILIGFCVRGFSYKDSNLASNTISYLHDKHEALEAKLTQYDARFGWNKNVATGGEWGVNFLQID